MPDDKQPGPPPDEINRPSFDEAATTSLFQAAQQVIAAHPEIRAVAMAIDYKGELGKAELLRIIWCGENGRVVRPDAVIGSIKAVTILLGHMFERAQHVEAALHKQLLETAAELTKQTQEVENRKNGTNTEKHTAGEQQPTSAATGEDPH